VRSFWDRFIIISNLEVNSILHFNRTRLAYQVQAKGNSRQRTDQLLVALAHANFKDNHHLLYWLVRNHAGDLCCGIGGRKKRAESSQRKRKLNSK
jgi:hypothetical protein